MKESFYLIQSGRNSKVGTTFTPNIELDGPYEIALHSLETYYSFPNVDEKNNKLRVSLNGSTWSELTIAVGCYEHKHINEELQRMMIAIGGNKSDLVLKANKNTFQSILTITGKVKVDFTVDNCIRTVLGFDSKIYEHGRHLSEHAVNIMRVNSIFVQTDVIGSAYVNGLQAPVIYSFFPDVPPGALLFNLGYLYTYQYNYPSFHV